MGYLTVVEVLLDAEADIQNNGGFPLIIAYEKRNTEMVELLLRRGGDVPKEVS